MVSKEVEDMGQPKLQVREHIVSAASLPEERDSGLVSRDELREDIKDAMVTLAKTMNGGEGEYEEERDLDPRVSVQDVIEERLEEKKPVSQLNLVLLAVIAAEVAGLAWILFVL